MINLCVTTFNRQDLLGAMLRSVFAGSVKPERVFVVNQVYGASRLIDPLSEIPVDVPLHIVGLGEKRGCEGSAVNWYLENVKEERVIAHEDVVFAYGSLQQFVETPGDFLIDASLGVMTYRDRCRKLAGLYDLTISPNFYRYVDVDYEDRLGQQGIHPTVVNCGIEHLCNGTAKGSLGPAWVEHARREEIARINYEVKWGRPVTPGGNTIGRGNWRQTNGTAYQVAL